MTTGNRRAVRIKEVRVNPVGFNYEIVPEDGGKPIPVSKKYLEDFLPEVGGFYVEDKDGQPSYSKHPL